MTQICMLHFTRHYIDILQEMLLSLMLFCGKFITLYVCRKLLKYSLVWRTYGKNKTVQFFCPTVYLESISDVIYRLPWGLLRFCKHVANLRNGAIRKWRYCCWSWPGSVMWRVTTLETTPCPEKKRPPYFPL